MVEAESQYSFRTNDFEGPLDLLLFLIKKNEVNIYDIPLAQITEQFLDYLSLIKDYDLDNLTEFYAMAANLLLIKSQMLLPFEVKYEEEDDDPKKELINQLIEYQRYKKLTKVLETRGLDCEWEIERKRIQMVLPFPNTNLWERVDVWSLLKSFSNIMLSLSNERIIDLYEEVTINEKITLLEEKIQMKGECLFTELVNSRGTLLDIVCAFLAVLEAVKIKLVCIFQNRMFGDILIKPYCSSSE